MEIIFDKLLELNGDKRTTSFSGRVTFYRNIWLDFRKVCEEKVHVLVTVDGNKFEITDTFENVVNNLKEWLNRYW